MEHQEAVLEMTQPLHCKKKFSKQYLEDYVSTVAQVYRLRKNRQTIMHLPCDY